MVAPLVLPLVLGASSVASAFIADRASQRAGDQQLAATNAAIAETRRLSEIQQREREAAIGDLTGAEGRALGEFDPDVQRGFEAGDIEAALLGLESGADPTQALETITNAPGLNFLLDRLQRDLDRSFNASGRFRAGESAEAVGNARLNALLGRFDVGVDRLADLRRGGTTARTNRANVIRGTARDVANVRTGGSRAEANIPNLLLNRGQTQAGTEFGRANALTGGLNNLASIAAFEQGRRDPLSSRNGVRRRFTLDDLGR